MTSSSFRLSPTWIEYALGFLQSDTEDPRTPSMDPVWRRLELEGALLARTWEDAEVAELLRLIREDRDEGRAAVCLLARFLPNDRIRAMLLAGEMAESLGAIAQHDYPDRNAPGSAAVQLWIAVDPAAVEAFLDTHDAVRFRASFGGEIRYRTDGDPTTPVLRLGPGEIDACVTFLRPPIAQPSGDDSEWLIARIAVTADDGAVWRAHVPFDATQFFEVLRVGIWPDARQQSSWTLRSLVTGAHCYSHRREWLSVLAGDDGLQAYAYYEKSLSLLLDVFVAREARERDASDAAGHGEDLLVVRARATTYGGIGDNTSCVPAVTAAGRFLGALLLSPIGPLSPRVMPVFRRTDPTGDWGRLTRRLYMDHASAHTYADRVLSSLAREYAPDLLTGPASDAVPESAILSLVTELELLGTPAAIARLEQLARERPSRTIDSALGRLGRLDRDLIQARAREWRETRGPDALEWLYYVCFPRQGTVLATGTNAAENWPAAIVELFGEPSSRRENSLLYENPDKTRSMDVRLNYGHVSAGMCFSWSPDRKAVAQTKPPRPVHGNAKVRLAAPCRFRVRDGGWLEMPGAAPVYCTVGLRVESAVPDGVPRIGPVTTDIYITLEVSDEHGRVYGCERPLTADAMTDWLRYETPSFKKRRDVTSHYRVAGAREALSTVHVTWGDATFSVAMEREPGDGLSGPATLSLTGMVSPASLRWTSRDLTSDYTTGSPDLVVVLSPPPGGAEWGRGIVVLEHVDTFVLFPEFLMVHSQPDPSSAPLFFSTGREGEPQPAVRVIADP